MYYGFLIMLNFKTVLYIRAFLLKTNLCINLICSILSHAVTLISSLTLSSLYELPHFILCL
jgi:hypothetical protein